MRRFFLCSLLLVLFLLLARGVSSAAGAWELGADLDLDTRERSSFFDHHYEPYGVSSRSDRSARLARSRGAGGPDAPHRVGDDIRLRYRDRDYRRVWVMGEFNDWEKEPMRRVDDVWEVDLPLEPGRYRYLFVVEFDDGRERERTDRSHDRRRRDRDRGWVSEIEVGRDGEIRNLERDRDDRRWSGRDDYDLELVDDMNLQYQRVDGFLLTVRPVFRSREPWTPALSGAVDYGFKSERAGGRLDFVQPLQSEGRVRFVFSAYDRTSFTDRTGVGDLENTLSTLVFREDNRDWYRREGLSFGVELEELRSVWARVELRSDEHSSLGRVVRAGWGGREDFLPNPAIDEGIVRSLFAQVRVGDAWNHLWMAWERADDGMLSTQYEFQQLTAQARWHLRMGRQQALDLRLRWGANLEGELPRQKRYLVGGIGTVRGYGYQSLLLGDDGERAAPSVYGGESMWLGNAEYSFGLEDDLGLALFFDTGVAYVERDADLDFGDLRSAFGLGIFTSDGDDDDGLLRLDLIKALDESGSDLMVQGRLKRMF